MKPKPKPKPKPPAKGAQRMRELGYRSVQIWLKAEDLERLRRAATLQAVTVAGFVCAATAAAVFHELAEGVDWMTDKAR